MKSSQTKLDHKLGKDHHDYHDKKVMNYHKFMYGLQSDPLNYQIDPNCKYFLLATLCKRNFEPLLKFLLKGWILKKSADKWFQARTLATDRPACAVYNVYCPFIVFFSANGEWPENCPSKFWQSHHTQVPESQAAHRLLQHPKLGVAEVRP